MKIKVNQVRNNELINSIEMNLPDDMEYIKEVHLCLQKQCKDSQINFYWGNNFILGRSPNQAAKIRRKILQIYNHKFKVAV